MKKNKDSHQLIKELKLLGNAKVIAFTGLFAAATTVLAFLAKSFLNFGAIRVTFECVPIFLAAFLFGPSIGAITALTADLISCLITAMTPIPLVTIGAVSVGFISGFLFKYLFKNKNLVITIPISVFSSHIIGSMIIKSFGLFPFFGTAVYFRIPLYLCISLVESIILTVIMKNRGFVNQIGRIIK